MNNKGFSNLTAFLIIVAIIVALYLGGVWSFNTGYEQGLKRGEELGFEEGRLYERLWLLNHPWVLERMLEEARMISEYWGELPREPILRDID